MPFSVPNVEHSPPRKSEKSSYIFKQMGRTVSMAPWAVQAVNDVTFSAEKRVLSVERYLKQNRFKQPRVITATDLDVQHQQNLRHGSP
jgi:hypothetical protein